MGFSLQRALLGGLAGVGQGVADVYEQKAKDEVAAQVRKENLDAQIAQEGRAEQTWQAHTKTNEDLTTARENSKRAYEKSQEEEKQAKFGAAKIAAFDAAKAEGKDPSSPEGLMIIGKHLESNGFEAQGKDYYGRGFDRLKYNTDVKNDAETFKLKKQELGIRSQEAAAGRNTKATEKELERYEKDQANIAKGITYDTKDDNGKMITVNVPQAQNDIETLDSMLPDDMPRHERLAVQRKFARSYTLNLSEGKSAAVSAKAAFASLQGAKPERAAPATAPAAPTAPAVKKVTKGLLDLDLTPDKVGFSARRPQ